ncbi:MAG: NADP-dependent oxidoreductase [Acidobacteria bacterium]|nr:NADP-dependent oxidoreductase [Acidobacteriota bacterium]
MKAVRIHRYGDNEAVLTEEVSSQTAGPGEVQVRIAAAGVNPVDWKIRSGYMSTVLPIPFPYTLGCEMAGTVEAVGPGVTGFAIGDKVYGYPNLMRSGCFAESIVMPESELALAPTSIATFEAAAYPVAAITAYDGLFTHGGLKAGDRVLILGGAGGVGSAAIQLARAQGAEVWATASTRNQSRLAELGAVAIDYTAQKTADVIRDVDLILDCVGPESGSEALPSLKHGGRYVTSVFCLPPAEVFQQRQITAAMYGIQPSGERLREISKSIDAGQLRMSIDREFSLDQVAEALAASQTGRTRGKLLVRVSAH